MKGGTHTTFFLGLFIVDVLIYLVVVGIIGLILWLGGFDIPGFAYLGLLWAISDPLFYLSFSFCFWVKKKDTKSTAGIIAFGTLLYFVLAQLSIGAWTSPESHEAATKSAILVSFLPIANFMLSITQILQRNTAYYNLNKDAEDYESSDVGPFSEYGCRDQVKLQLVFIVLYTLLLVLTFAGRCNRKFDFEDLAAERQSVEDKLVKAERQRIEAGSSDLLVVDKLVKRYRQQDKSPQDNQVDPVFDRRPTLQNRPSADAP